MAQGSLRSWYCSALVSCTLASPRKLGQALARVQDAHGSVKARCKAKSLTDTVEPARKVGASDSRCLDGSHAL